jgi:hypothetical protein
MPGVVVNTSVRTAPTTANVAPTSTFFVVGTAERGPLLPVLVTSLAQFEATYGTYNPMYSLHQQVQTYFEEGGSQVYVVRATNATTSGALNIDTGTLLLTAANVGDWSDELEAEVVASASTFVVKVYYRSDLVYATSPVATAGDAASAINNSALATLYLTAVAGNASATLGDSAAAAFSGGDSDDGIIMLEDVGTALDLFDSAYGTGAVAVPGLYGDAGYELLIQHAVDHNRIALLGFDPTSTTVDDVVAEALTVKEGEHAEYAAFYWPSVIIPGEAGTSLTISPEGYVAAKRARAHNTIGAWQAPAGVISRANFVTGVAVPLTGTLGDALDAECINAIRIIQNSVRVYGARSASADVANFKFITARDVLNYVAAQAAISLEDLLFTTIDGRRTVFGQVESRLISILEPIRSAGGLYEGFSADNIQIDPGYSVEVSDAINPVTQLADGIVRAKVGVRVSGTGDRIIVDIIKSNLTSSVV